jgi:hypothetical protein
MAAIGMVAPGPDTTGMAEIGMAATGVAIIGTITIMVMMSSS